MGVPKFFRYISERYPLISQLVADNRISEFDNLYLDMNGIIHACTHNDDEPTLSMTEEQMFAGIMRYIDQLFEVIQPRRLFYLAVDGVAPRAKMNQQRARRFKSKREAQERAAQAARSAAKNGGGAAVSTEPPFDSNCITPGTDMMTRLSVHLKYYIALRIKEDPRWRSIRVIFSGYEAPGEGEHKIMSFIRSQRSLPDYDPNTRHCLYGLDADLIMLGLVSHETHFALLREEVTFGPKKHKAKHTGTRFYLMHLSLFREFLDLEFGAAREQLPFAYEVDRVVDDFVLLAYFVGNDFLPSLPSLYIPNGSLAVMFQLYKRLLPKLGGYMNERGTLNLQRVEMFLRELAENERTIFDSEMADKAWLKNRLLSRANPARPDEKEEPRVVLTSSQCVVFDQIKNFFLNFSTADIEELRVYAPEVPVDMENELCFPATLSSKDRQFAARVADELCLSHEVIGSGKDRSLVVWQDEQLNLAHMMEPGHFARVIARYENAVIRNDDFVEVDDANREAYEAAFAEWKRNYYRTKLKIDPSDVSAVKAVRNSYVEGLQWVLHYYYDGVASWSWYFPYHYAPLMSDLVDLHEVPIHFELGKPFQPFEQLLAVLPPQSLPLVPPVYRPLMMAEESPIRDFYPLHFESDLNGKKNDWEAVVLIPFIDQQRLLRAMQPYNERLSKEEQMRNSFGPELVFTYDGTKDYAFPSPTAGALFPDIAHCPVAVQIFVNPDVPRDKGFRQGRLPGALFGVDALAGFPTLYTLPIRAELRMHGVRVFDAESKSESHVVTLMTPQEPPEAVAAKLLGNKCYVGWPFLIEAIVVGVSTNLFTYQRRVTAGNKNVGKIAVDALPQPNGAAVEAWERKADQIETEYSKRGILTGVIGTLVHVKPLKGLKRQQDGKIVKEYDHIEQLVPDLAVVEHVKNEDKRFMERLAPALEDEMPLGSHVLYLAPQPYGCLATVEAVDNIREVVSVSLHDEAQSIAASAKPVAISRVEEEYYESAVVARTLGISVNALFRLTGSIMVLPTDGSSVVNIGLNLKFHHKGLRVVGFSRMANKRWEFSQATIDLLHNYRARFPDLFATLLSTEAENNQYLESDLFPRDAAPGQGLDSVRQWLRATGVDSLQRVSVTSERLTAAEVARAAAEIDQRLAAQTAAALSGAPPAKRVLTGIKPALVLTPELALFRLGNQTFRLGDRVRLCTWLAIGFGSWGTVVAVELPKVQVLLDQATSHAGTLEGLCPQGRGVEVDAFGLLNLSRPVAPIGVPHSAQQPAAAAAAADTAGAPSARARSGRASKGAAAPAAPQKGPVKILQRGADPKPLTVSYAEMVGAETSNGARKPNQQQPSSHGMPVIMAPRPPTFVPSFLDTPAPAPMLVPSVPLADLQAVLAGGRPPAAISALLAPRPPADPGQQLLNALKVPEPVAVHKNGSAPMLPAGMPTYAYVPPELRLFSGPPVPMPVPMQSYPAMVVARPHQAPRPPPAAGPSPFVPLQAQRPKKTPSAPGAPATAPQPASGP